MLVTKQIEIDMGHRVCFHKSKCRNLHGHRYKIEAGVDDKVIRGTTQSDEGMVIDFSDLKAILMEEIDARYDHGFVLYDKDPYVSGFEALMTMNDQSPAKFHRVPFIPTAENLAKHWYQLTEPRLRERGIKLEYICVWETPTSTAKYTRQNAERGE